MSAPSRAAIENALSNRVAYPAATDADVPGRAGSPAALQAIYDGASLGFRVLVENGNRYTKTSMTPYALGGRITQEDATGSFVPTDDNLTDLGDASHRFRTLYLGTSVANAGNLAIELSGGGTTSLTLSNPTAGQVCDFYLDGAVRFSGPSPELNATADLLLNLNGAGVARTFAVRNSGAGGTCNIATDGNITPDATNTQDLGAPGARWQTLYLGTSLFTPSIQSSASLAVDVADAGTAIVTLRNPTSHLLALSIEGTVLPDGVRDIGASGPGQRWNAVYAGSVDASARVTGAGGVVPFVGTVAQVAAIAAPTPGLQAYATNGRCIGEGPGAGTGVLACWNGVQWSIADGSALAA